MKKNKHHEVELTSHEVELTSEERQTLETLVRFGEHNALEIRRANILLKAGAKGPAWTDAKIAEAFGCHQQTVYNVRKRWREREGLPAVKRKPQSRSSRLLKLDGSGEARLIALLVAIPPNLSMSGNRFNLQPIKRINAYLLYVFIFVIKTYKGSCSQVKLF